MIVARLGMLRQAHEQSKIRNIELAIQFWNDCRNLSTIRCMAMKASNNERELWETRVFLQGFWKQSLWAVLENSELSGNIGTQSLLFEISQLCDNCEARHNQVCLIQAGLPVISLIITCLFQIRLGFGSLPAPLSPNSIYLDTKVTFPCRLKSYIS